MNSDNLHNISVQGLLKLYSKVLAELLTRGVVRSTNNPVADYAEHLVIVAMNLKPAAKCEKGYDAVDRLGRKYEIKGRRSTEANKSRMLSAIRDCNAHQFDFLAGVLFHEDFTFNKACLVPFKVVVAESKYREHVNAYIFNLRDSVWNLPGVIDITAKLQKVANLES